MLNSGQCKECTELDIWHYAVTPHNDTQTSAQRGLESDNNDFHLRETYSLQVDAQSGGRVYEMLNVLLKTSQQIIPAARSLVSFVPAGKPKH